MACKLLGYWPVLYWEQSWNKFDAMIVTISWLAIFLRLGSVQAVRAIRTIRIVLVSELKLRRYSPQLLSYVPT